MSLSSEWLEFRNMLRANRKAAGLELSEEDERLICTSFQAGYTTGLVDGRAQGASEKLSEIKRVLEIPTERHPKR